MTSEEVELDIASLTRALEQLNGEVHGSRVGVLDAIRSRGAEFSAASGQVSELQRRVTELKEDLGIASTATPAALAAPVLALQAADVQQASERHSQLKAQLSELDEGVGILAILLEVRRMLARVEDHLSGHRFTQAAEHLQNAAASLAEISAPTGMDEPDMIRSAKAEYSRLRASLVADLDAGFHELVFSGTDASAGCAASVERLQELWSLYQVLGLRGRRLDRLSCEVRRTLLAPLLAAAARLGPGRCLRRLKQSPGPGRPGFARGVLGFAWEEAPTKAASASARHSGETVLPPLLELFEEAWHWAGELPEVYAALGSRLYAHAARQLLSHFEVYDLDEGRAIEEFETRLQSRGFIRASESPLQRHVRQLSFAKDEARRASILVQAKAWLQAESADLVSVDDAAFHDVTELLQSEVPSPPKPPELQKSLRLPSMKVSSVLLRLVRCILSSVKAAWDGQQEAKETLELVRRLCMLFALVRPHVHQLKVDAKLCSVFLADVLCLVNILIWLPYRWPTPHPADLVTLDLVPQLRQLGELHFTGMLRYQKDQLFSALLPCNLGRGAAEDAAYVATEAALGAAAQQLKVFCSGVYGVLPAQILRESVLLLLGFFCKELVRRHLEAADEPLSKPTKVDLAAGVGRVVGVGGRLLETFAGAAGVGGSGSDDFREVLAGLKDPRVPDASPQMEVWVLDGEDVSSVIALLTSAQAMVRQSLQAANLAAVEDEVPGYSELQLVADLLGSDFSRFLQGRKKILKTMQRDEVIRLMKLSWQDEDYKQGLVDADCPNPLILALLLVSEVQLQAPPWYDLDRAFALLRSPGDDVMYDFAQAISEEGRSLHDVGLRLAKEASPFQQHLMASAPAAWPLRKALKRVQAAQDRLSDAVPLIAQAVLGGHAPSACATVLPGVAGTSLPAPGGFNTACWDGPAASSARLDLVVAHCREPLDWLHTKLTKMPPGSRLFLYEKCGAWTDPSSFAAGPFQAVRVIARPDIGAARGDECSAYLTHILANYQKLADFIVFLQSDPMDHLHMDFLDLVLRSIAAGTYDVGFLPLNGPRHVRTLTPCLQAVHEEIFGENLTALVGPYCCAQFAVSRETVQQRSLDFFSRMLSLVDGSRDVDLCGVEGTKRSTQCYGFEFLWHVVFGEEVDPPSREDDMRLPVSLRLKHGKEHSRLNWIGMPLARDIPLKLVPDHEHGNPMFAEEKGVCRQEAALPREINRPLCRV
ncbi:acbC [Symbiodinium sp. CCMP2592]|nr:acbC [Symbiodinium sp. CCMP2592]